MPYCSKVFRAARKQNETRKRENQTPSVELFRQKNVAVADNALRCCDTV